MTDSVAILDFGSQYNQLIARRVREARVYCEIFPPNVSVHELQKRGVKGIILSGGPASVYSQGAPSCDLSLFRCGLPVLGICYGMQLGCRSLGGRVIAAKAREYGRAVLDVGHRDGLFDGVPRASTVWMSHGDRVERLGRDFEILASTDDCAAAAVRHRSIPFYGVQFHPEVHHTECGVRILRNFLRNVCGCRGDWEMGTFIEQSVRGILEKVGDSGVLCALSGGVDSTVVAALVHRAIGRRLVCVFVDNGLLRLQEVRCVRESLRPLGLNLRVVDASREFIRALQGVTDPERKRKIIGKIFIDVFRRESRKLKDLRFLAQGTLYPDVIESQSTFGGPSATIKSHHNVGGLPRRLGFRLLEPLRMLFKDEVRELGRRLGLPEEILGRQPFPGPGLAVRILGAVSHEKLEILRAADAIIQEEMKRSGWYRRAWQSFAVLLPVQTVGVMGDARTYENVVAVRAVESVDGMTADWARLPHELLERIASRVIREVKGVNRVVYDISSKPPATIEWE